MGDIIVIIFGKYDQPPSQIFTENLLCIRLHTYWEYSEEDRKPPVRFMLY